VQTFTRDQAIEEAGRCLDCDLMCSTCEWVCPNRAIFTFHTGDLPERLPILIARGSAVGVESTEPFPIAQQLQVALLADLCNECGNCTTFCPTSGSPYRDKPRLYFSPEEFEAQSDNAFIVESGPNGWTIRGRFTGVQHALALDGRLRYSSDTLAVEFDPANLEFLHATVAKKTAATTISLHQFAALWVLLRGFTGSARWLPTAETTEGGG
jgi:putative selenate reductase